MVCTLLSQYYSLAAHFSVAAKELENKSQQKYWAVSWYNTIQYNPIFDIYIYIIAVTKEKYRTHFELPAEISDLICMGQIQAVLCILDKTDHVKKIHRIYISLLHVDSPQNLAYILFWL